MDFQTEYDQLTKQIDDTITSQVSSSSSWINVPGSLVKAVSSPAGYVWGYNTNNAVFVGSTSELQKLLKQGFLNNKE